MLGMGSMAPTPQSPVSNDMVELLQLPFDQSDLPEDFLEKCKYKAFCEHVKRHNFSLMTPKRFLCGL